MNGEELARIRAHAVKVAADAPPLSDEAKEALAAILRPAASAVKPRPVPGKAA